MKDIIRAIIEEIPKNCIFDAHYVIKTVISMNPDDYLRFAYKYTADKGTTGVVNGQLSMLIGEQKDLCSRMEHKSFSRHLRDQGSECAAWLRK